MRPDFDTLDLPPDPPSTGGPITVFYDCEFTDITSDADLLSIGFVAADSENELYIEIGDANRAQASLFVRHEVLPKFGMHNPQVLKRVGAAARIEEWLDDLRGGDRQQQIVVLSDSTWDWQFLLELFIPMPGEPPWARSFNVASRLVQQYLDSGRQTACFNEALDMFHREHRQQHHALVDARGLKLAYMESRFA